MSQPPQKGKRIVSTGEYIARRIKQSGLQLITGTGICGALVCVVIAAIFLFMLVVGIADLAIGYRHGIVSRDGVWSVFSLLICVVVISAVAYVLGMAAERSNDLSAKEEEFVLLTRANIADLPVCDSLVRASAEPRQNQEAVLLRAATETQETPPEQLVRAVNGPE